MPSFTSRHYTPDRFRSLSNPEDDLMEDISHTTARPRSKTAATTASTLTLVPSDGSLLDYFDLPSPPSTPHRPTHSLSYSSLNSFPSPATSPSHRGSRSPASLSSISGGSSSSGTLTPPTSSPPTSTLPRWPTASQRMHHRLPTRPRSRSTSTTSSLSSASSSTSSPADIEMANTNTNTSPNTSSNTSRPNTITPLIRQARRTPYYPPNASRNVDRARVYMNRGPHFVPNWTPLTSLPRHVQLQIEERMVRFTAG